MFYVRVNLYFKIFDHVNIYLNNQKLLLMAKWSKISMYTRWSSEYFFHFLLKFSLKFCYIGLKPIQKGLMPIFENPNTRFFGKLPELQLLDNEPVQVVWAIFQRKIKGEKKSILTRSVWAFFFEFQQNSKMATNIANANPQRRTTKTPPKNSKESENINYLGAAANQCLKIKQFKKKWKKKSSI